MIATLPTQPDELLAIFVSEGTAGFVGGLASRVVASLIGDKKRDTSFLKGTTSGAYFGIRGAIKSTAAFLGLPRPVATLVADVAASLIAESAKAIGRKTAEDEDFFYDLLEGGVVQTRGYEPASRLALSSFTSTRSHYQRRRED